jgi:catechol 2,3-dioxygenase-like lactoylglutathione lyase family enzyme
VALRALWVANVIALADCAVSVTNARESARWWKEKLGFGVHTVGSGDHAIMVAPPGDRFVVHLCEGFEPVEAGNSGIAFVTDELEPLVRRMEGAGVVFTEPLKLESWGGMAKFADPDGNVYWLLGAPTAFIRKATAQRAPQAGRSRPRTKVRAAPGRRRRARRSDSKR